MARQITNKTNKKDQVIEELFRICKANNTFEFHNDLVKDVCRKVGFGNPSYVTKLDNKTMEIPNSKEKLRTFFAFM